MSAPEVTREHRRLAGRMRRKALAGWYVGDERSLELFGARHLTGGATDPELLISLLLSRDKMHHSVGWWRNAEYEYCWHLSVSAKPIEELGPHPDIPLWGVTPYAQVPRAEIRYWIHAFFPVDFDKVWMEPGGTDPRLTREEARAHATMWHARLFLHPTILDPRGEPFHPFIPQGEVYDLTRWIDGLTPEKVDR